MLTLPGSGGLGGAAPAARSGKPGAQQRGFYDPPEKGSEKGAGGDQVRPFDKTDIRQLCCAATPLEIMISLW
jgi:hypothetical protein